MNISYLKSTFTARFLLALLAFALTGTNSYVRADDATPPLELSRAPYIQSTTTHSIQLVWETNKPTRTFVQYKLTTTPESKANFTNANTVIQAQPQTRHHSTLHNLQASAVYDYRVGAQGKVLFTGQFQTNKSAINDYQFAIWGDSGTGSDGQKLLAEQIIDSKPDFLLHTGDLIYPDGAAADFDPKFFDVYQKVLSRVPFYGALGNHDIATENGQPFLDAFHFPQNGPVGLTPERNFYMDYANARIAVIDSNVDESTLHTKVVPWLERVMSDDASMWKFIVIHHPAYSSGANGDTARIQKVLSPVFAKLHIDVVFSGHDHHYERFQPIDGVTYIITGAGGAGRYPRKTQNPQSATFWNDDWSFTHIQISTKNGNSVLHGKQISTTGEVVDAWELSKY